MATVTIRGVSDDLLQDINDATHEAKKAGLTTSQQKMLMKLLIDNYKKAKPQPAVEVKPQPVQVNNEPALSKLF